MTQPETQRDGWHLDKRVPLALIVTILVQTFGFGWMMASQAARIERLEEFAAENKTVLVDAAIFRTRLENIEQSLRRIERALTVNRDYQP